jgi:putative transcriptional regulator
LKNLIKEIRKSKKLSQEDLAESCGVSRQTINAIENNKYNPSLSLAFSLARKLDVTVDGLFLYREDE